MRWLSLTDIVYLLHCLTTCAFVDSGYYITENGKTSESKALMIYVWILLTPMWNISAAASDFIIVCMTFHR